ncbi:hypothetical protein Tco_0757554, partial [Tanacetum coccineum]
ADLEISMHGDYYGDYYGLFVTDPRPALENSGEPGKPRVAYKVVCRPKEQGGLGIKPLQKWNEVLLVKQLWKIEGKESNWVKWVSMVKLKKRSILEISIFSKGSWGWRNLLAVMDKVKNFSLYEIGDGK